MCGICGIINFDISVVDPIQLINMRDSMTQRGPDDKGAVILTGKSKERRAKSVQFKNIHEFSAVDNQLPAYNIGLAHRRLSIIDLSAAGHQPMSSHDETVWIVYNGEVYNFRELRQELKQKGYQFKSKTDTEVILHLYAEMGERFLEKLNGMFAFAIWDSRESKLFMARDRLGIKPLYYHWDKRSLLFASEVRALLESGLVPRTLSGAGLQSYLMFGGVQSPLTLLENVYSLMPGHKIVVQDGVLQIDPYWNIHDYLNSYSISDMTEKLPALLEDSVRMRMISDVPIGAFLSGGIDSSVIVSLMSQADVSQIKTVSLVFEEREFDERDHARKVAELFGTEHHEITFSERALLSGLPDALKAMDQPTVDGVNTYFVSRAARESGLTVVLSGLGGDEVFGGYESFRAVPGMERYRHIFQSMPTFVKKGLSSVYGALSPKNDRHLKIATFLAKGRSPLEHSYFMMRAFFTEDKLRQLLRQETNFWEEECFRLHVLRLLNKAEKMDSINQVSLFEMMTYMRDILLRDTDFMSMSHSLEVRVPLIDYRLVEIMLSIPGRFKLDGPGTKHLLWQNLRHALPDSIIHRPKQGFTLPFGRWLKQKLYSEVKDVLLSPVDKVPELVYQHEIEQVCKEFEMGRTSWHRVWILYVLKKWVERYIS